MASIVVAKRVIGQLVIENWDVEVQQPLVYVI